MGMGSSSSSFSNCTSAVSRFFRLRSRPPPPPNSSSSSYSISKNIFKGRHIRDEERWRSLSCSLPLFSSSTYPIVPLTLAAATAATLASFNLQTSAYNSSLHHSGAAGKENTKIFVQGAHKKVPSELIDELKSVCKTRKEALWACFIMELNSEDVCVPLSQLAECKSESKKELDASALVCEVIAHAGDENFHTFILFDPNQEEQRREAERPNHFIVHTALSMEGTCTGEHGISTRKMKYLKEELGMETLKMTR